jgi:hypothetical protein
MRSSVLGHVCDESHPCSSPRPNCPCWTDSNSHGYLSCDRAALKQDRRDSKHPRPAKSRRNPRLNSPSHTQTMPACQIGAAVAVTLVLLGTGMAGGAWFGSVYPPILGIIATGLLTFFYLLYHAIRSAPDAPIQDRDVRIAIAGSITTTYLALVGFGVFMRTMPTGESGVPDPRAQSLVVSFTTTVGIVIASYFGATAYVEGKAASASARTPKTEPSDSETKTTK